MEPTCQASYPLNSENESPFGTFTVYLSCAEMAQLPTRASTPVIIGIVRILLPFIASTSFVKFSVLTFFTCGWARASETWRRKARSVPEMAIHHPESLRLLRGEVRLVSPYLLACDASAQPSKILLHEIAAHLGDVGISQAFGDGSRHVAVADLGTIEAAHAGDAEACRGQKHLLGVRSVEQIDVRFDCWNGELVREIERHLAADAGKNVTFTRGIERAPADHKDVAAHPLGEISVDIEQHRPALGIMRFHRLLRDDHVKVVVRLSARAEHVRRDAALRGRPYIETVAELTRARLERQRRAFHNDVRTAVLGHFITDRINAATA